jgi:threonine/homoserine/homoserine lactone efflux protein
VWPGAIHDLPLFVAAALLLNVTPGPDMLYVAGTSAARGARAGVAAALGIGAGCGLHIALAALGVSALIAASPLAFGALKWLGAAYLVWAGVALLSRKRRAAPGSLAPLGGRTPPCGGPGVLRRRSADAEVAPSLPERAAVRGVFWQGALINALNPKVALFFLALLPQFIDVAAPAQAWAFVVLGLLFDVGGTAVNVAVALGVAGLRRRASRHSPARRFGLWLERTAGLLFVALGLKLALGARA